ncbi:selenocysteine-specific translation elongation factor [Pseudorhodoferax sp.]|uniref:selenocysteine-specific translation elongation factor n=1 Tax=Pseudorhodoferax sp. TaxID=1993553 RepID=UPI0039E6897F
MIIGTAGHIDHGKTTLVRALTGVDTDRLPEEKQRGISIALGYAFLDAPGLAERIGFIDVPGHERLVHTMLAGATGIDFALLLVAADDGPMPQTREHLAVLSLLGVAHGAVAVTKCDRADAARIAQVRADVQALLAGTPLAGCPVLEVAATTGAGVDALRALLVEAARTHRRQETAGAAFRLAVDRAFTLTGAGTVATGTVHAGSVGAGSVGAGAQLALVPGRAERMLRVRSVHAQNQAVDAAHAGQRCALGLAGIAREDIARGQWLVAPEAALATVRLDALLTLWHGEDGPLRSGTTVHLHLGAADVLASVALLDLLPATGAATAPQSLAPDRSALVQLVLRQPAAAWRGDRVVLRDATASRTLAGGMVLDPFAPARYRRTPQRLAELAARMLPGAPERLAAQLAAAPWGLSLADWARAEGLASGQLPALPPGLLRTSGGDGAAWALGAAQAAALGDRTVAALHDFHQREPDRLGMDAARLRRLAAPRLPEPLWQALLAALQAQGRAAVRGAFVFEPQHALRLSAADRRIAERIAPLLAQAGNEGSWVRDLARALGEPEAAVRTSLARLAQAGELHQVVKDLYYPHPRVAALAALVRRTAAQAAGDVTAAAFRDATGLGRKRAIQLLEHFDRIGLLRRVGDVHRLRGDSRLFIDDTA